MLNSKPLSNLTASRPRRWFSTYHRGYTLIELSIILAIFATFAALSWPVMMRPWKQSVVQADAEKLREILGEARQTAISNAATYEFLYKPGTNEYEIRSRDPLVSQQPNAIDARSADTNFPSNDRLATKGEMLPKREHHFIVRGRLSDGIIFAPDQRLLDVQKQQADPRQNQNANTNAAPDLSSQANQPSGQQNGQVDQQHFHWARAVALQPNGRTSNAELELHSAEGFSIKIRLRGFTGAISLGPAIERMPAEEMHDGAAENAMDAPSIDGEQFGEKRFGDQGSDGDETLNAGAFR